MKYLARIAFVVVLMVGFEPAMAVPIACSDSIGTENYMEVDDTQVSACLGSGLGSLSGNPANDPFLLSSAGAGYGLITKSDDVAVLFSLMFTQSGPTAPTGTWSVDASVWDAYSDLAIGFKFGTGNQPDNWFVFSVVDLVTNGEWDFFNRGERGGGLSHVNLYGVPMQTVPEPGTLLLLASGLFLIAWRRRTIQTV